MTTVGESLKRERELREISVEEIARFTKILPVFINSLEADDFDKLPAGVFTRGFIRAYSQFVGINGEDMVNLYIQQTGSMENNISDEPVTDENSEEGSPVILFTSISVIIVIIVVVALYFSKGTVDEQVPVNEVITEELPAVIEVDKKLPTPVEEEVLSEVPEIVTEKLIMKIVLLEDSWMQVVADGENRLEGLIKSGEERVFNAKSSFRISAGNAGGVKILLNGTEMSSLGKAGEVVRNVMYSKDSLPGENKLSATEEVMEENAH